MSKSDSDSEQSYNSDDSDFNYIPGPHMIEVFEEANSNAAASPTDLELDPDTFKPLQVKSGFQSMKKSKKPKLTLKVSFRTVMKGNNL